MAGSKWECNGFPVPAPKSPRKAGWVKQFTVKKGGLWGRGLKGK